jgi:RNA polymerase sigma factor for flagellar operon FliA
VNYQRLLLDHLQLVDQIIRTTGRRRHLSQAELDDFGSFVRLRLIENDYAILRKFQNRSSWWTYLSAVIERLSLDYCAEKWGRWRPSAVAERLGLAAVTLERLVSRDGHTLEEALEIIRSHHSLGISEADLLKIWEQLPLRVRTTEVREEAAAAMPSQQTSEQNVEDTELRKNIERLERALQTALAQCSSQERVLLALRFDQDLSMVQIAKLTGNSVPTLHRRLDKAVRHLRVSLSRSGLDRRQIVELIGHPSIALAPLLRAEVEKFLGPVRLFNRDG